MSELFNPAVSDQVAPWYADHFQMIAASTNKHGNKESNLMQTTLCLKKTAHFLFLQ